MLEHHEVAVVAVGLVLARHRRHPNSQHFQPLAVAHRQVGLPQAEGVVQHRAGEVARGYAAQSNMYSSGGGHARVIGSGSVQRWREARIARTTTGSRISASSSYSSPHGHRRGSIPSVRIEGACRRAGRGGPRPRPGLARSPRRPSDGAGCPPDPGRRLRSQPDPRTASRLTCRSPRSSACAPPPGSRLEPSRTIVVVTRGFILPPFIMSPDRPRVFAAADPASGLSRPT